MPITTPAECVERYGGDPDHFVHVLQVLFIPAVKAAGLKPVSPIAQGSEVIHADIIHQLETADLVLCDMSVLNTNVFFELGMRTAFDKPVCLVRNEYTLRIPFDTSISNHYRYDSAIRSWDMDAAIQTLAQHIKDTLQRSEGRNSMYRHFGVQAKAQVAEGNVGAEDTLNFLVRRIESIGTDIRELRAQQLTARVGTPTVGTKRSISHISVPDVRERRFAEQIAEGLRREADLIGMPVGETSITGYPPRITVTVGIENPEKQEILGNWVRHNCPPGSSIEFFEWP
ncbi:hypothetical protein ACXR0O_15480 [Verrucomicrobiota bacterium sgz303538]